MSFENLLQKTAAYSFPLAVGFVGLLFMAYGVASLVGSRDDEQIVFQQASSNSEKSQKQEIVVDIEGAVEKPGVYKLAEDARVIDVISAASGFLKDANKQWIEKNINLSAKVKDGFKLYIPFQDEQTPSSTQEVSGATSSSLVNINTASSGELDSLSGIGPVTAQKIIDGRPYGSIEELFEKKIISQTLFEKIKDKIAIY